MAQPPNFEIPQQLRELTEKNLEQARAGYGQFMDAMTQAMGFWTQAAPANPMTRVSRSSRTAPSSSPSRMPRRASTWRPNSPTPRTFRRRE